MVSYNEITRTFEYNDLHGSTLICKTMAALKEQTEIIHGINIIALLN
jgi:hypothetical protein